MPFVHVYSVMRFQINYIGNNQDSESMEKQYRIVYTCLGSLWQCKNVMIYIMLLNFSIKANMNLNDRIFCLKSALKKLVKLTPDGQVVPKCARYPVVMIGFH